MSFIGIVIVVLVTLIASKLYRLTPLHDGGFTIWSAQTPRQMKTVKRIFARFGSKLTFDFSDEAVMRQAFANSFDVVNCSLDEELTQRLSATGIDSARAFVTRNPARAAHTAMNYLRDAYPLEDIDVLVNPDPCVKLGYMAFVMVRGQHWMYVFRRHKLLMMIDAFGYKRRQKKRSR